MRKKAIYSDSELEDLVFSKLMIEHYILKEGRREPELIGGTGEAAVSAAKGFFGFLKQGAKFLKDNRQSIIKGVEIVGKGASELGEFAEDVGLGKEDLAKFVGAAKEVGMENLKLRAKRLQQLRESYGPEQAAKVLEIENKVKLLKAKKKYQTKRPEFPVPTQGPGFGPRPGWGGGYGPPPPQYPPRYYQPQQPPPQQYCGCQQRYSYPPPPPPPRQREAPRPRPLPRIKPENDLERKEAIEALIGIKHKLDEIRTQ